ncbi:hypothetical protein L2E82_44413 [Cichorium intybus]|uniref:Uncharacterized protein n=1 Tax=Cichorium intybus TaxID=13427 RepID=A0ACB8ZR94_CICIN|nr:hypothetical protein L2E82_44413 [Cichorium intybus]
MSLGLLPAWCCISSYEKVQRVGGITAPKKKSVTGIREAAASQNATPQSCNRIGCCGRLSHTKVTKNKCLERPKVSKPSIRSSSVKEVSRSSSSKTSSSSSSSVTNVKKSPQETEKKIPSKIETIPKKVTTLPNDFGIQERKLKSRNTEVASSSSRIKKVCSSVMENSQPESNNGRRRRFFQGESSSSGKGKRVIGLPANEGRPVVSTSGISVSAPKNSRNCTPSKANGVSSVRTRRSLKMDSLKESVDLSSSVNSVDVIHNHDTSSSHAETVSSSTDTETSSTMANGTRRFTLDGIADVLPALDRIEQNKELTYEELLALEEKMGTVSTSLSKEELSKCIKKYISVCAIRRWKNDA